jgi:hypothetical protein
VFFRLILIFLTIVRFGDLVGLGIFKNCSHATQHKEKNSSAAPEKNEPKSDLESQRSLSLAKEVIHIPYAPEKHFQRRFGDDQAPWVLVCYTALSCEFCGELHRDIVEPLKNHPLVQNKDLFVIYRDYPKDILSLYASCCLWGLADNLQGPLIEKTLFEALTSENPQDRWQTIAEGQKIEEKQLQTLTQTFQRLLRPILGDQVHKIGKAITDKKLQKRIFDARVLQKKALKIENVPMAFLIDRTLSLDNPEKWKVYDLFDQIENLPGMLSFLEKKIAKAKIQKNSKDLVQKTPKKESQP